MPLHIIWAQDESGAIGREGDLPWRQRSDLRHFKQATMGHPVVMGRRTWESLPFPLPGRENVVLTRDLSWSAEGAERTSIDEVLGRSSTKEVVFVIGGGEVYAQLVPHASILHRTVVHTTVEGADTFAPAVDDALWTLDASTFVPAGDGDEHDLTFERWSRT
jgi:dihydrofolate reductase